MKRLLLLPWLLTTVFAAEPIKIHFIGNSYTAANNLPNMLKALAATHPAGPQFEVSKTTRGGAWLQQHASNAELKKQLLEMKPDWVVLQEQSQMAISKNIEAKGFKIESGRDFMHRHARTLDAWVKEAGGETIFYMTWAREKIPQQTVGLAEAYDAIARELDARVAPVGLAFAEAGKQGYDLYTKDGSHPSAAGTFLAACCFYTALSGEAAVLLDNEAGIAKLDARTTKSLQAIATRVCEERGLISAAPDVEATAR